ncbi:dead box atp-dependent rna helicase i-like protein [Dermatophagoides farinae]|nr:uncharacterized protein LOC124495127 [Dermatophagoides farinae]KAH7637355.1 dead box atp-dependent rna helicase i-like protein [Dermatophagoides farinae]
MTKSDQIASLRHHLQNLFVLIDSGNDLKFIQNYEKYVDKLVKFMKVYRSYATKLDMFDAVQKKVEALINSPEISSLIKESLRPKFDRANELAAGFSELIPKRTLDKNNAIVKSMHAIRRGEISAVHPNFYVDDSISQDESSEKNLRTLRSTPSRLAYQSNKRAESTECMEKKSSPMCSTIGVDNDETNLSNQRSSNGEKIDGTKIFDHNVNCSPQQQSSSIESMNKSSQALADSNDDNSSVDLSRSLLQQEENRKILKDYDYQYRRLDLIVKTLMDKKASKLTLHRLTQEVKRVLEDWLFPLNDNFYPLFLFDKDANVHFEFFILDPESPVTITNRSPCSDMRIFELSKLIYAFVYEYCQTISK